MAIIKCPGCRKSISNRAALCNHCGGDVQAMLAGKAQPPRQRKPKHMQLQAFVALLLFVVGAWLFIDDRHAALAGRGVWMLAVPLMMAGIVYYGVLRALGVWRN